LLRLQAMKLQKRIQTATQQAMAGQGQAVAG
jgi:hypothetical protein